MATTTAAIDRELALAFADLLTYPYQPIGAGASLCEELALGESAAAAELVGAFRAFADETPLGTLQEAFTLAFDLDSLRESEPTCYPYVGHHLFEENHKRSALILGLRELYRRHGFEDDPGDLPDHLATVLRFLAACDDDELVAETLDEAVLPALARMTASLPGGEPTDGRGRYRQLVVALALALGARRPPVELDLYEREWSRPGDSLGISRDTCGH